MFQRHFDILIPEFESRNGRALYRPVLPRGAMLIASSARSRGWKASIFDGYSFPGTIAKYLTCLPRRRPNAIGLSIHGAPNLEPATKIAQEICRLVPTAQRFIGGQLVDVAPEVVVPYFDNDTCLMSGDNPSFVAKLLDNAKSGISQAPSINAWTELPDLEALDQPLLRYISEGDFEYHLETQLGCPFRCFHCGTGQKGLIAKVILRSMDSLREEIGMAVSAFQNTAEFLPPFWVTDETFLSNLGHAEQVCDVFQRIPNLRWRAQTRADTVTPDILKKMRSAGCRSLAFGVEIPADSGLNLVGKRETMIEIKSAFTLCHRIGIKPEAIVIVGTPGDKTGLQSMFDALRRLGAESVQSYIYHPVPGSPWWRKYGLREDACAPVEYWKELDFHGPPLENCHRDAVVSQFLALQVWDKDAAELLPPARSSASFRCIKCHQFSEQRLLQEAPPVRVLHETRGSQAVILAVGSSRSICYCPKGKSRGNIWADCMDLDPLFVARSLGQVCIPCILASVHA